MIAVVVAGVLAAIAVPSYNALVRSTRLTTQANEFVRALNLARSEAIKRGTTVNIAATNAGNAANEWGPGWVLYEDTNDNSALDGTEDVRRRGDPLTGTLTLDGADSNGNDIALIRFRSTGTPSISPVTMTFDLCDGVAGSTGRRISISQTGRVSMADFGCP